MIKIGKILSFPDTTSNKKMLFILNDEPETKPLIRKLQKEYPDSTIQITPDLIWNEADAVVTIEGVTPFFLEWFVGDDCKSMGIPWIRCKEEEATKKQMLYDRYRKIQAHAYRKKRHGFKILR